MLDRANFCGVFRGGLCVELGEREPFRETRVLVLKAVFSEVGCVFHLPECDLRVLLRKVWQFREISSGNEGSRLGVNGEPFEFFSEFSVVWRAGVTGAES